MTSSETEMKELGEAHYMVSQLKIANPYLSSMTKKLLQMKEAFTEMIITHVYKRTHK